MKFRSGSSDHISGPSTLSSYSFIFAPTFEGDWSQKPGYEMLPLHSIQICVSDSFFFFSLLFMPLLFFNFLLCKNPHLSQASNQSDNFLCFGVFSTGMKWKSIIHSKNMDVPVHTTERQILLTVWPNRYRQLLNYIPYAALPLLAQFKDLHCSNPNPEPQLRAKY